MGKTVIYTVTLIFALIGVRVVGVHLFYDPLIDFFHEQSYQNLPLPKIEMWKFGLSLFLRFTLNTLITLGLVKVIFNQIELLKLTVVIYAIVFLVLAPVLLWLVQNADLDQYRYLFYSRRILIHPILTLILIPAFLYNERVAKTEKK